MAINTDLGRNAALNGFAAQMNSGKLVIHNASHTAIATISFGGTAFQAASGGSASINPMTQDNAAVGGTAAHAHFLTSGLAEVMQLTVGVGSGEIQMGSLVIAPNDRVGCSSLTISIAAS